MRNLFDQYYQPENRLTHALLSCLNADRALLQRFILWSVGIKVDGRRLEVLEQSLPGDHPDLSEEETEKRGLPDGCIYEEQGWALLIESKFQAVVTSDQIRRHIRSAARRGLANCSVLVLTVKSVRQRIPNDVFVRHWTEVYEWLQRQTTSSTWARLCRDYFEVAEAKEVANQYLEEGTLTVFSGIPFGKDEPYTYLQAKRLLGLLRQELLNDRRLEKRLGADPESKGRGAITGRAGSAVWDFISLREARRAKQFTEYPHLSLGILNERFESCVTVPNGIKPGLRHGLLGENYSDFERLITQVTVSLIEVVRSAPGSVPMIVLVQRHYANQRSQAVHDCWLRFDPRTAIETRARVRGGVKLQPQWLQAVYVALRSRRSNLQFQIGVDFPYRSCPTVATPTIVPVAADVWLACRPLVKAIVSD